MLAERLGFDTFYFCSLDKFEEDVMSQIEKFEKSCKPMKIKILTKKELLLADTQKMNWTDSVGSDFHE